MPATSQYHVVLDGQGYLIDLNTYRKRVNEPFAPKRRSGDPGYGDLALASVWPQEGWALGMGKKTWDQAWKAHEAGYDAGYGIDPHFGDLRMGRSLMSVHSPASVTSINELLRYNDALYSTRGDGQEVYKSTDGSSWSTAVSTGESALRNMAIFNGWLIAASNSSGKLFKYDGTSWSSPWVTLTAAEVQGVATYPVSGTEYLFCGCRQSATRVNQINQVNTAGTAVVAATIREPYIETMAAWDGLLWISAYDDTGGHLHCTLYTYDGGSKLTEVLRMQDNAISALQAYDGELYAGSRTRGKIWTLTRQGLKEVFNFPDVDGIGGTSTYAMPLRCMVVDDQRLHVPIVDVNGLGIYTFDGSGWANLAAGGLGQEPRFLASFKSDLYLSNKSSAGARVYRIERKSPTSATWVSASFDAGLAATDKLWLRLDLYHAALTSNEAIVVDYEEDGDGVWTSLGTSSTVGATSKSFSFATATTARKLRLRLTITLTDQTHTPKITGILVSYTVAQDVKAEWEFDALLEGSAQTPLVRLDNSNETKTGPQLADALWASRAKKSTLAFTDLDAEAKTAHFVDLEEKVASVATQRLGHQTRGRVTLVEA